MDDFDNHHILEGEAPTIGQTRKMAAALAAHRIGLWNYHFPSDSYDFSEGFFEIVGLADAGIRFSTFGEFASFVHREDSRALCEAVGRIKGGTFSKRLRFRCVGPAGKVVWLEVNVLDSQYDERGELVGVSAYVANVTEECEREIQLRQVEGRNRKIIEALPEFIFIFDERFYLLDVMLSQDRVLLHSLEELIGHDAREVYSPEVCDLFVRNIRQCLADNTIREIEYPAFKDGAVYYFQARIAPFEEGTVMALIHDIGDRVAWSQELIDAKERAEEADRMKSVFLATMSHEIRTPLNAIVGFSEILAADDEPGSREEYIGIIRNNSGLLLQLINDILDLSRIESGRSEMHFESVEAGGLLDEVGKVHRIKMSPEVRFDIEVPEGKVWLTTDRNRLTQVLFNFLSNAIKNTERGSITLGMRLQEDLTLDLYVRDTGRGIPSDKLDAIFNAFEKLDDFAQGTGLGLSICRSIAERLGGQIEVSSELGVGSEFSLHLPYVRWVRNNGVCNGIATDNTAQRRKVILVAEPVESNFKLLSTMLGTEYTLRWANSGGEAVNSFLRERPDLILMEIKLPDMTGYEAAERIRAVSPDIPIVAVTSNAVYAKEQLALSAGCNIVVSKPYARPVLQQVFSALLQKNED